MNVVNVLAMLPPIYNTYIYDRITSTLCFEQTSLNFELHFINYRFSLEIRCQVYTKSIISLKYFEDVTPSYFEIALSCNFFSKWLCICLSYYHQIWFQGRFLFLTIIKQLDSINKYFRQITHNAIVTVKELNSNKQ